jgi:hypothetical protein
MTSETITKLTGTTANGNDVTIANAGNNLVTVLRGDSLLTRQQVAHVSYNKVILNDDGTIQIGEKAITPHDPTQVAAFFNGLTTPEPGPTQWEQFKTPLEGIASRWQYAVVNTGSFNSQERMRTVLGNAGQSGWELTTVYDKSSNWLQGMEKGFMLMRRPVPEGVNVTSKRRNDEVPSSGGLSHRSLMPNTASIRPSPPPFAESSPKRGRQALVRTRRGPRRASVSCPPMTSAGSGASEHLDCQPTHVRR